jgi:NAD(P)-dependent dehydrogenase (short-subunit alcohol dehydrogenase family)
MITNRGIDAIARGLPSRYAKHNIRFNAVAPAAGERGIARRELGQADPRFSRELTRFLKRHLWFQ